MLSLTRYPNVPGLPRKEQHRVGRAELLGTTFATFERNIRDQLSRILSSGGFDPRRDILGIMVNRWGHGYSYTYNSLYDPPDWVFTETDRRACVTARQPYGLIAIANSDAAASPHTDAAFLTAHWAVEQVLSKRAFPFIAQNAKARVRAAPHSGAQLMHLGGREGLVRAGFCDVRRLDYGPLPVELARVIQTDDVVERIGQVLIRERREGGHDTAGDRRAVDRDGAYHAKENHPLEVVPSGRRGGDLAGASGEARELPGHACPAELVAHRAVVIEDGVVARGLRHGRAPEGRAGEERQAEKHQVKRPLFGHGDYTGSGGDYP